MTQTFPGVAESDPRARLDDGDRLAVAARSTLPHVGDSTPLGPFTIVKSGQVSMIVCAPAETAPLPTQRTGEPKTEAALGPLSPREAEVARLVSDGHSNQSIARELSISVGTAERHVANIFSKLGFNRRSQVAVWFVRRLLLTSGI
jgi:DNA-binding CsgD family transcriptional regulator